MFERVALKAYLFAVSITASQSSIAKGGHSSFTGKVKNNSAVEQNDVFICLLVELRE